MRYFVIGLVLLLMLVGCGNKGTDHATKSPSNEEGTEQKDEGESQETTEFKAIDVKVDDEEIHIKGNANVSNGVIYYEIEDQEGKTLLKEQEVELDETDDWSKFSIDISAKKVKDAGDTAILLMYGKDENGKEINTNHVPVDLSLVE